MNKQVKKAELKKFAFISGRNIIIRTCNICESMFRANHSNDRYCDLCKSHSELYIHSERLPKMIFT